MTPKILIKEFIDVVWNKNNPSLISKYIDKDYIVHLLGSGNEGNGIEWVKNNVIDTHKEYPNFQIIVVNTVCEDDVVVSQLHLSSTKNGHVIASDEFILHKIKNNKIVEAWSLGNQWK